MLTENVLPKRTVSIQFEASVWPTSQDSEGNATTDALVSVTKPHKDMNCNEKRWSDE